jgi:hypothetical protein
MERIVTLQELRDLRERLCSPNLTKSEYEKIRAVIGNDFSNHQKEESTSSNVEKGKALVKANPNAPSLLEKTGFSNIIYLATISLVFEVLFLAVSILIYK